MTPASNTTLSFPTWTHLEKSCGESRVWAGVHFPDAVPAGQNIAKQIIDGAYTFFDDHLKGVGLARQLHGHTGRKLS